MMTMRGSLGGVASTDASGQMTPDDLRQIGVSLGKYADTTDTAAAQTAAFTALLANEKDIYIPRGSWVVNPATPFALQSGQRIFGAASGRHGIDPGSSVLSRITVPAGFNGVDIFNGAQGVAHVTLEDFLVDLSAAAVGNTGKGVVLATAGTAEEAQWNFHRFQVYGPFTTGIEIGSGRRACFLEDARVFRGGSTVVGTGIVVNGTDTVIMRPIVSGGSSTDAWVGIKAYAGLTRIWGGDVFGCGTGISTSNTNSDGIFIGGGISVDRCYSQGIYLSIGSGGIVDGVVLHSNSQEADGADPHIKCDSTDTWTIDGLDVFAESGFTNQAKSVIGFGTGASARIGKRIRVKGGVGAGVGPAVRTAVITGTNFDSWTAVNDFQMLQEFTAAGTTAGVVLPPDATEAEITVVSGGGGGGSGRKGAAGSARTGGGGGAGGAVNRIVITGAALLESWTVVVGGGGAGGAAITASDTTGNGGVGGGSSSVTAATSGVLCRAGGGNPGAGGGLGTAGGGGSGTASIETAQAGGSGSSTGGAGGNAGTTLQAPTGGGAGGGATSADASTAGGNGGRSDGLGVNGPTGGAINTAGTAGTAATAVQRQQGVGMGTGGSGGGGSITSAGGGIGGAGAAPGGAGGGGGAGLNSVGNSGAGGAGAAGYVCIRVKRH